MFVRIVLCDTVKDWKQIRGQVDRWIREYLLTIQTWDKWLNVRKNLKPDDIVLVRNIQASRSLWPKVIGEKVCCEPDGQVRTAKLRTANEQIVWNVRSLCLLEATGYLATTTQEHGLCVRFEGSVKCYWLTNPSTITWNAHHISFFWPHMNMPCLFTSHNFMSIIWQFSIVDSFFLSSSYRLVCYLRLSFPLFKGNR